MENTSTPDQTGRVAPVRTDAGQGPGGAKNQLAVMHCPGESIC